jgi:hypothetical protein
VRGADGNLEFLAHCRRGAKAADPAQLADEAMTMAAAS